MAFFRNNRIFILGSIYCQAVATKVYIHQLFNLAIIYRLDTLSCNNKKVPVVLESVPYTPIRVHLSLKTVVSDAFVGILSHQST